MKKVSFVLSLLVISGAAYGQSLYTVQTLSNEDLAGTARYVGLGGAMNYLGANLSTLDGNPAGSALYRRNDIAMTSSFLTFSGASSFQNVKKNGLSFDQIGFLYSSRIRNSRLQFVNIGFNYQKSTNFKGLFNTNGDLNGYSQSITGVNLANIYGDDYSAMSNGGLSYDIPILNGLYNSFMISRDDSKWLPSIGNSYDYFRGEYGGIQAYDFNLSFNVSDKLYIGTSLGIYNVDWNNITHYTEVLNAPQDAANKYYMSSEQSISGAGVNAKFGLIYRPFGSNPFRFGVSFTTPTWFQLTGINALYLDSPYRHGNENRTQSTFSTGNFDFGLITPWKMNIGLASTFFNRLAVSAEYEYKNLSTGNIRYPNNNYTWDNSWSNYKTDKATKAQINTYLKGVYTLKLGAEYRLSKHIALRGGYNYITAPVKNNAFLNLYANAGTHYADSPSLLNITNTDYINLRDIHRETIGVGYTKKSFYIDIAYMHQHQKADIYPFHDIREYKNDNEITQYSMKPQSKAIKLDKIIISLGFRF